ncbi:hypothetical protein MLD38_038220 [Melastoma candidum]|uniref:Uncharacterized protein n=1 Tax=Melastoma candidum TaxID=119954 RepID=A0ACB9KZE8_9MYRT|nr:hypothetical protein MLD38_038220 [Melastoma candidum]
MLGVNSRKLTGGKKEAGERRKGSAKKGLKVVYISSPMKVTTSAAEFRATVQELTGRDSDVARIMERGDWYSSRNREDSEEGMRPGTDDAPQYSNNSLGSSEGSGGYCPNYFGGFESGSPSESDSLFHEMCLQHRDVDVYKSSLFQDSTLLEVLGSFD